MSLTYLDAGTPEELARRARLRDAIRDSDEYRRWCEAITEKRHRDGTLLQGTGCFLVPSRRVLRQVLCPACLMRLDHVHGSLAPVRWTPDTDG